MQTLRKIFYQFILTIMFLMTIRMSHASECGYIDGGYCLSNMIAEACFLIESRTEIKDKITLAGSDTDFRQALTNFRDPNLIYMQYEIVWDLLIKNSLATEEEKKKSFDEASKVGGTKIGGANLVVLGALTFQKFVDLKLVTIEEAQKFLDEAKERGFE
ncbi:hypothetical protein K1X76_10880 [bacterium]|nr:hypothetical protein [bacterium]